jgi:hypothetical protein
VLHVTGGPTLISLYIQIKEIHDTFYGVDLSIGLSLVSRVA